MARGRPTIRRVLLTWVLGLVVLAAIGVAVPYLSTSQWDLAMVRFCFVVTVGLGWCVVMGVMVLRGLRAGRDRRE